MIEGKRQRHANPEYPWRNKQRVTRIGGVRVRVLKVCGRDVEGHVGRLLAMLRWFCLEINGPVRKQI